MDFSEKWGTSIDEAVRLALEDLKLTRDEVNVTVLEEPSRGFFGIGQKLAKVRVEKITVVKAPEPEEIKEKTAAKPASAERSAERTAPSGEKKTERPQRDRSERPERRDDRRPERGERGDRRERGRRDRDRERPQRSESKLALRVRPDDLQEMTEHPALTFLNEVSEKMGLVLEVKCYVNEENVFIDIEGKDSGTIIGKRGQTLDAIQYLTSLVVNKDSEKYIRVVIDAENYRAKRERTLEQLANRLADKVKRSGKSVRLEPMNPYERKVIHATLQGRPEVTTRSEGEEPYRRVIIERK